MEQGRAATVTGQSGDARTRERAFSLGRERIRLTLRAIPIGRDFQILLEGGASHLGAVAVAGAGKSSVAEGVISVPGHREAAIARDMASRLAESLECTVCVCAGIHFDAISREEIDMVAHLAEKLADRFLASLQTGEEDA